MSVLAKILFWILPRGLIFVVGEAIGFYILEITNEWFRSASLMACAAPAFYVCAAMFILGSPIVAFTWFEPRKIK